MSFNPSKTITVATTALVVGLAGLAPAPAAANVAQIEEPPVLVTECPELTGCVNPPVDPDPQVNPELPGGNGNVTITTIDPCIFLDCPEPDPEVNPELPGGNDDLTVTPIDPCIFLDCPDDGDDDPDPEVNPELPGGDGGLTTPPIDPCVFLDCPDDGDDDPEPTEPEPGDDDPEPTEPGDDPEPTEPEPGDDDSGDDDSDGGASGIDKPRPGNPTFTG